MSAFEPTPKEFVMSKAFFMCGVTLIALSGIAAGAWAQGSSVPNLASTAYGFQLTGGTDFHPVEGAAVGPITFDPEHPHVGNNEGGQPTERVADLSNPNLKPFAVEVMKTHNDAVLNGKRGFVAQSRCWPGGGPGQLLFPAEPIYFIQTPQEVWIIWQRDHHVRRVFLNRQHSENPKPTWYGESVGHYENGDTLVIDTIGIMEHPFSFVDNYRTPHTKDLHTVERWKLLPGGRAIEGTVTVEDPGAFYKPWTGMVRWNRVDRGPMIESVCAENNANYFDLDEYPMPQAKTADF
jgi:hypothetical protein